MKKLLWTSAMALTAAACMTACDDSSSGASNSIPEFKTEAALPDTCEMEVAKAGDTYFACFENKWIEVTDSATVEQLKEGLDEDEVKAKLEELEDQLKPATPAKPKSSSSKKTDEDVDSSDSEEPESSASEEECTGRRCKTGNSSSSKKSSGGSGSGEGGSGEGGEGGSGSGEGGSGEGGESASSGTSTESASSGTSTESASSGTSTESASSEEVCRLIKINSYSDGKKVAVVKAVKDNSTYGLLEAKLAVDKVPSYVVATMEKSKAEAVVAALKEADSDISLSEETAKECPSLCAGVTHDEANTICDRRTPFPIYKIVKIGTQTWMAENLNYPTSSGSYCNPDVENYCETYGRLYDWATATSATNPVCPDGWRIPTLQEYKDLIVYVGNLAEYTENNTAGNKLKATTGWDGFAGDGSYEFNLMPAGFYNNTKDEYEKVGSVAMVLASDDKYSYLLTNNSYTWAFAYEYTTVAARSVRCIKDDE